MKILASIVFVGLLFFVVVDATCGQGDNLVVNGSFEEPAVKVSEGFNAPSFEIEGWFLSGGSVDLNSTRWDPFHLDQSIDLVGTAPGTIEQLIVTNPDRTYYLTFVFANNPEIMTGGTLIGQVQVVGGSGVIFSETFDHANSDPMDMDYEPFSGCFVADSAQCLLRLKAINEIGNGGVVVDLVSLVEVLQGDVNGDKDVNLLDVTPFVDAVSQGIYSPEADANCDGMVNLLDVAPFVDLLLG